VLGDDGGVRLALINKDASTAADVSIAIPSLSGDAAASVLRLEAPSLEARSGVTLGGSSVAADGGWMPGPLEAAERSSGAWHIHLAAASAALLFIGAAAPELRP
jgi:Glycosyl hydrolase family 79 C-terminal beta domain